MLKRLRKRYLEKMEDNNTNENKEEKKFLSFNTLKNLKIAYIPYNELLKEGFFAGIGWAFGVTIGFVVVSFLIVFMLRSLGGLPLIGGWIADVVEETQLQLISRTPIFK